jgi:hypothetical protein
MADVLKAVEAPINTDLPELYPGDAVSVHFRIKEGASARVATMQTSPFAARLHMVLGLNARSLSVRPGSRRLSCNAAPMCAVPSFTTCGSVAGRKPVSRKSAGRNGLTQTRTCSSSCTFFLFPRIRHQGLHMVEALFRVFDNPLEKLIDLRGRFSR